MARPPMKAASTVLIAIEVAPKRCPSRRAHTTSWIKPAAPERRKATVKGDRKRSVSTRARRSAFRSDNCASRRTRRSVLDVLAITAALVLIRSRVHDAQRRADTDDAPRMPARSPIDRSAALLGLVVVVLANARYL